MGEFWARYRRDKAAVVALVALLALVAMASLGPLVLSEGPNVGDLKLRNQGVSAEAVFGTDQLGRDIFTRIVFGARYTLLSGLFATTIGTLGGFLIGIVSGYHGGWADGLLMRAVDLMLGFPFFLIAILIIAILGGGLSNAVVAVGIAKVPVFARYVRGLALQSKQAGYVESAHAVGCTDARIMFRHIMPNIAIPTVALATVQLAGTILSISGLSFLGLGAQPPTPEWGLMISDARSYLSSSPHIMVFPGISLAILVLAINLVGDGLQFATDPKRRRRN